MKKKIIVISAGRYDYSRFYSVLKKLLNSRNSKFYLYLTVANFNKIFNNINTNYSLGNLEKSKYK